MHRKPTQLKEKFKERMKDLLEGEYDDFIESLKGEPLRSIRVNELKISPEELKRNLEAKGWEMNQPVMDHPEIMVIDSELEPGELGRSFEHLLGYYYVQEISSMMPPIVLNPKPHERVLDLCASPGSKTTQMAAMMKNTGLIIANEVEFGRMKILSSNIERCGVTNAIVTKKDGAVLCDKLAKNGFEFDKVLVDAPCSGEGTLRSNSKTAAMWNPKGIGKMSRIQKRLLTSAFKVLKIGGELVYSTCTYAPEEDEEVIDFILHELGGEIQIERIKLPLKHHSGILKWQEKEYLEDVKSCCRIFPFDENTEGFFITKLKKLR